MTASDFRVPSPSPARLGRRCPVPTFGEQDCWLARQRSGHVVQAAPRERHPTLLDLIGKETS